jgi:hypothetical protein
MRLFVYIGKLAIAAIFLRRVEIDGCSYAAAPTQVTKIVTPPHLRHKISAAAMSPPPPPPPPPHPTSRFFFSNELPVSRRFFNRPCGKPMGKNFWEVVCTDNGIGGSGGYCGNSN